MRQLIKKRFILLTVFIFGLTPLIWFYKRGTVLITGSDTNFPLNPAVWLVRRFFVWQSVGNAGSDFSASTAGTFFHFIQFLPFKIGFSLQHVELISLLFWFLLIVFSSYWFAKNFLPKNKISQLIFVVFYSFNIYLFNTWENVKVSNLALTAAIPFGLSILTLLKEKRISKVQALLLATVNGIIISGAGINPAYIICFFLIMFIYILGEFLVNISVRSLIERLTELFVLFIGIFVVNLFWILPTFSFIFSSISGAGSIDKIGYTNWVDSLSQNTSILNILRLQGAWDWYSIDSVTKIPLYIPYAVNYFFNPVFLIFSFLIPTLCFISYLFKNTKNLFLYISFGIMLVLGVFLGVGTHLPTGDIFKFISNHIPFFSLFRSPWYIFTPLLTLSLAGLLSLLFYNIGSYFKNRMFGKVAILTGVILVVGNIIYNYPLVTGRIFRPLSHDNFYINFPSYVFDSEKWLSRQNSERIIGYPDNEIERFSWGYNSIESVLNLFSNKEILFSSLNGPESPISQIIREFYSSIEKGEMMKSNLLSSSLSIGKIFYKFDEETLSPNLLPKLKNFTSVSFGNWSFFNYPNDQFKQQKIFIVHNLFLAKPFDASAKIMSLIKKSDVSLNPDDSVVQNLKLKNVDIGQIIYSTNSQLKNLNDVQNDSYNLKDRFIDKSLTSVDFSFYISDTGDYSPVLQSYGLDSFGIKNIDNLIVSLDGNVVSLKLEKTDDSYLYFSSMHFLSGNHKISLQLANPNLVDSSYNNFTTDTVINNIKDPNGSYISILNKSNKDVWLNFKVNNFDPYFSYLVKVKYKQIYGDNAAALTDQQNKQTLVKSDVQRFPNYPEWGMFNYFYTPVRTESSLNIKLVAPFIKDALGTKIEYGDLYVSKVFTNDLFFVKSPNLSVIDRSVINFKEVSPVLYEGEVHNAPSSQTLSFLENYSPNWQLEVFDNNGNEINAKLSHFTLDYYANGWYLDGVPQDYKFKIFYTRQNMLVYGYVLSVSFLIFVIALNMFLFIRNKHGKNN